MSLPVQHTLPVNIQYVYIIHPVSMTNLRISSQTLCDVSIRFVLSTFELKLKDIVELTNLRDKERCEERKRERGREREGGREGDKHIVANIQVQDSLVHNPRLYYQLFQHLSVSRASTECASPPSNAGTKRRETDFAASSAASYFCDAFKPHPLIN